MDLNGFVNIIGLLAMIITWFIVSPLKEAIVSLQKLVDRLNESLEERRKEMISLGERVAGGEAKIDENEKHITRLENELHAICNNCKCKRD